MSTRTIPNFMGKLEVTAGVNDRIDWQEDNGGVGAPFDLNATVAAGSYWPGDLAIAIAAAMTTASAASGDTIVYTGAYDVSTGKITITASAGVWFPKITAAESQKVLIGGDTDSAGNPLATGQYTWNHCGFQLDVAYPAAAAAFTSDVVVANTWIPNEVMATDSGWLFDQGSLVTEAIASDGTSTVRDWRGWNLNTSDPDFVSWGGNWANREITFEFLTADIREWWIFWVWGPYAKSGGTFRFFPDKSNAAFYDGVVRLTGESLRVAWRGERLRGYDFYSHALTIKREALS